MDTPEEAVKKTEGKKKGRRQSAFMRAVSRLLGIPTRESLAKEISEGKNLEKRYGDKIKVKEQEKSNEALSPLIERIRKASIDATLQLLKKDPRKKIDAVEFKDEIVRESRLNRSTEGVPQGAFRKAFAESVGKSQDEIRRAERAAMVKAIIKGDSGGEAVDFGVRANIEGRNVVVNLDNVVVNLDTESGEEDLDKIQKEEEEYVDKSADIENKEERKAKIREEISLLKEIRKARKDGESTDSETTKGLIEKVEKFLSEGEETVLLEEVLAVYDLDEDTRKQIHTSVISEITESTREESFMRYDEIRDKTARKPLHTELLELSADKLIVKHNEARDFYEGKTGEERKGQDEKLRGIVNEALGIGEKAPGAKLNEKNTILQVPGGVAIVTSDAKQFSQLVNMGEDHEAIAENLAEQSVAGAYLKGKLAESIEEKGYKGDVMIIYSRDAREDVEKNWQDKAIKDDATKDLIYHEIEHLLQERTLETIEDLHSGSDIVLENKFRGKEGSRYENLLTIYRDIRDKGKESEYYKQSPDDPIFRILAEGKITKEAGILQLVSLYYGSRGIEFDALRSVERRGRIFEEDPAQKGIKIDAGKVFELAESRTTITTEGNTVIDPWKDIVKENPLLQAVYFGELKANEAKEIYDDFDSPERLMMIKDEIDGLMKTKRLTSISQLIHKISTGEITIEEGSELKKLKLISMFNEKGNDLKFVKRASEILSSFFKDTETRDALFEYSAILTGGKMAFGEGLTYLESPSNTALIGLYNNVLGEKNLGPGDISLRRLYLQTPEGEIPDEHLKIFKLMIAVDMILQRAGKNTDDEFDANRRHIVSMIYTDYNKGVDYLLQKLTDITGLTGYLNKEDLEKIDRGLQEIMKGEQDPNLLKEMIYGSKDKYVIPYNPDVDFSVFPSQRYIKDILGEDNANKTIDMVDALQGSYALPFAAGRHRHYEEEAEKLKQSGAPDYLVRAVRMRSPFHRAGEEASMDSNWYMKIIESFPFLGGFITPGKVEWAKSGFVFPGGHPQYGRSMKRIPIVGPLIERHFPVALDTGIGGRFNEITGKFETGLGAAIGEMKFDPGQLITGDKNVKGVLQGMQIGLGGLGMDELEQMAFLKAMPMFRTIQMSRASAPQIIPSQAALEEDGKQIWADRTSPAAVHQWGVDFKNEILWGDNWDGTKITVDDKIADAQRELAGLQGLDRYTKNAAGIIKKIKGLMGVKQEAQTMEKIYKLMEDQEKLPPEKRFDMRHLVEMSRKAHEGGFWNPDPTQPRKYYFKVGITNPDDPDGDPILFDLKDVNTFVQRYNRTYAKEIFFSGKDPNTGEDLEAASPIVEETRLHVKLLDKELARLNTLLPLYANDPVKQQETKVEIDKLTVQRDAYQSEVDEMSHKYTFAEGFGKGYDKEKFFNIVWGEVDGYVDNMKQGMEYFTNYQFRVAQTAMMERRSFVAFTFFTKLDRILNNIGHWSMVAGLAFTIATGSPIGITIVLGGAALVLADTIFVNKYSQLWLARRIKALETGEKLDGMLQMYEDVQSGKFLTPANLDFLERQKARIEFMTESIMRVTAKESVKLQADRPLFAISAGLLTLFDQYGVNMLSGKI